MLHVYWIFIIYFSDLKKKKKGLVIGAAQINLKLTCSKPFWYSHVVLNTKKKNKSEIEQNVFCLLATVW